ncbi:MAG: tRNA pseudouridine(55) synthase TruB [Saprospiraceae bacterium]
MEELTVLNKANLSNVDFLEGTVILVDKPKDWTSFDVVNKIRGTLKYNLKIKKIKVGHSGTLDPMATGLLLLCTGKYTKNLHLLQDRDKTYTGSMTLGATTPSYDAESEIEETFPTDHIKKEELSEIAKQFLGEIQQVPPMFSAIKVNGQPLYKLARRGESIELEPRNIRIDKFEVKVGEWPRLEFEVDCSKGTYIRSLAHDYGRALNSGAYLDALRRTKIGEYSIEDAWNLDDLIKAIKERYNAS